MEFKQLNVLLKDKFATMTAGASHLFELNVDTDVLWETYLESFPPGTNEMFRERREYDCNSCRTFIKRAANVVALKDGQLDTIWNIRSLKVSLLCNLIELIKGFSIFCS